MTSTIKTRKKNPLKVERSDPPKREISFEDYNRILRGLEPISIRLVNSKCTVMEEATSSTLTVKIKYAPTLEEFSKGAVMINVKYRFTAFEKEPTKPLLEIIAEYAIRLRSKEEFSKAFFNVYKDNSLPINVWPYFREYVQSTLGRMGFPPFILPFLIRFGSTKTITKTTNT